MTLKESAGFAVSGLTLLGLLYAACLQGGWIVNDAKAQVIAQREVGKEEVARLEFTREVKFSRLKYLNAQENPTPDEKLEMELLRDEIRSIQTRLEELRKQ